MPDRPIPDRTIDPPSLAALFACFARIGMQGFGGGLSAWMRRDIVTRRGWMAERQFLTGLALAQIAPGANASNLAVFIGSSLRGGAGGVAAFLGLMLLPAALVLAAAGAYFAAAGAPGMRWVASALAGMGAAAIGLNLANGIQLTRRNVRSVPAASVMVATAVAVGVLRWQLLPVLAVVIPVSFALNGRARDKQR